MPFRTSCHTDGSNLTKREVTTITTKNMNQQNILNRLGIARLSVMQEQVIASVASDKRNIVVLSPTGSGKTLAYLLSLLPMIDTRSDAIQLLVIVPGRELALQSERVLNDMKTGIRAMSLYGGRPTMDEHRVYKQFLPQVIFGTPGRLNDHFSKGNILSSTIRYVVIDEFDKCLQMGFRDEMQKLLGVLPHTQRNLLLSATDSEEIVAFMGDEKSLKLDFTDGVEPPSTRTTEYRVMSPEKDKLDCLERLLRHLGEQSSIVFLNYRDSVERTFAFLKDKGFTVAMLHGGKEQRMREDALYRFSNGSANILVATDLASRGLDIDHVANVIHYHLPLDADSHTHRVGRTARWDAEGRIFYLLGPEESLPSFIRSEPATYELPEELPLPARPTMVTLYIGKGKKDKISKGDIVGFLCKTGGLAPTEIGRIDVKERYAYAAVAFAKHEQVLRKVTGAKIKGVKTIVELIHE